MASGRTFVVAIGLVLYDLLVSASVQADWSIDAGGDLVYTDHVFHFSSAFEQELLEDPSFPAPAVFGKQGDVIWEPSVKARWSPRNGSSTELGITARGFIYTDHPALNHGDFRIYLKQKLSPTNSIRVRYQTEPDVFLQPNFESRTGRRTIQDERVTSHIGSFEFTQRLGERWDVMFESRYGGRLYNDAFAQRDTRLWTIGPALTYVLTDQVKLIAGYLFERGTADGRNDIQFSDDISYDAHLASIGLDADVSRAFSLHLSYVYKRKLFTTDLATDHEHFDRRDDTHQGNIELRYKVAERVHVALGFKRTERSSTNPLFPYKSNVVSFGMYYHY